MSWFNVTTLASRAFVCGHCNKHVASDKGYISQAKYPGESRYEIYICSWCKSPNFFSSSGVQVPGVAPGNPVKGLPKDISLLYEETRQCMSVSSYTASVMLCRKILMHIAVEKDAEENKPFKYYVDYLKEKHYLPSDSEKWVNHIREKGNEANHEITICTKEDAQNLIRFVEMLTKFIYEYSSFNPINQSNAENIDS